MPRAQLSSPPVSCEPPLGPTLQGDVIRFRLAGDETDFRAVRLCQEIRRPRVGPALEAVAGKRLWETSFPRPEVDRIEYQFEVEYPSGERKRTLDPANPNVVADHLGAKSVFELPGYVSPAWLQDGTVGNPLRKEHIAVEALGKSFPVLLWSARDLAQQHPAPLLIVHDGPDYAGRASLIRFLEHMTGTGRLPVMRAALLPPVGDRDDLYSASQAYGRALGEEILPALARLVAVSPGRNARVGMGASLGALAMLHAHRTVPGAFGALYLQSGSFFQSELDSQEAGFVCFERITRFVGALLSGGYWAHPVPVLMTCGAVEENLANNRTMRAALVAQGYDADLHVNRDAHNWVSWRDTFEPHLLLLLQRMWGTPSAGRRRR
jgi:enterochelin esterase-like enzyme